MCDILQKAISKSLFINDHKTGIVTLLHCNNKSIAAITKTISRFFIFLEYQKSNMLYEYIGCKKHYSLICNS